MSNKRIQKKHKKERLIRDILRLGKIKDPKLIRTIHNMTMGDLYRVHRDCIIRLMMRDVPFLRMRPREKIACDLVHWRPMISFERSTP